MRSQLLEIINYNNNYCNSDNIIMISKQIYLF